MFAWSSHSAWWQRVTGFLVTFSALEAGKVAAWKSGFTAVPCLAYCVLAAMLQVVEAALLKPLPTLQCAEIAEHLAGDMARESLKGKTLTLKLKTTAFEVRTRAHSLPQHISTAAEIEAAALRLLREELPIEIRLMGMRMSHFLEVRKEAGQQSIAAFVKQGSHHHAGESCWVRSEMLHTIT